MRILTLFCACLFAVTGVMPVRAAKTRAGTVRPVDLRCEYRVNPLAIGSTVPGLSWRLVSKERAQGQNAYQILVASSRRKLDANTGDLWNSGKVSSSQTLEIPYQGKPLRSREVCFWKVRVWDWQRVSSPWSAPAMWAVGLLKPSDWTAQWIGLNEPADKTLAAPMLRRQFRIPKKVKRAVVYISGLGQFELHLNGQKVGRDVLEPGWTDYRKSCLYLTYDVTQRLRRGPNVLGVILGNGMYNVVRGGRYVKFTGSFGPPKVILQLEITYDDGTSGRVVTDGSWRVVPSPITFNSIYGGEDYDARRAARGGDTPGLDENKLQHATVMAGPGGHLVPQNIPPIRVMHIYKPVRITQPEPGVYVYDLGQNFSGWPRITVRGPRGATVKIIPGELLDGQGFVTQRSSGSPAYFRYTLRGRGVETWHPRFSYYGFRYLQIEGATRNPAQVRRKPLLLAVEGQFVHSSAGDVGSFSCSNPLFNHIHAIIKAAIESNMQSIMTDCPHREKLGWLEEDNFMGPSVMFNFDVSSLFRKIVRDMREAQLSNGLVPDTAPEYVVFKNGFRDSPEWGSSYLAVAWYLYRWYGNVKVLRDNYEGFKKYVDYLTGRTQGHILSYGLGDWYDLGPRPPGFAQLTPKAVTATGIYYYDLNVLRKVADLLRHSADAQKYAALADEVRSAFNQKYFHASTDSYATGSQTSDAMPLALGMAPAGTQAGLVRNIVQDIRAHGNKMTTGEIGHRYLLQVLANAGRSDVIYDIDSQMDAPGYGYILKQGATALTEAWDAGRDSSQNHFMLGHLEEWFYRDLAGISQAPGSIGFKKIVIKPQPVGNVTWCKASYQSIRGEIATSWSVAGERFHLRVVLPTNTSATVYLPAKSADSVTESGRRAETSEGVRFLRMEHGDAVYEVGSGSYDFVSAAGP
ncbi:MAG TPA: glycoside hydrolase family 78 protein [Terriglobia bacterium]|nr:glycoside hydrolase family 78 protein [Terriglobia bacterium]